MACSSRSRECSRPSPGFPRFAGTTWAIGSGAKAWSTWKPPANAGRGILFATAHLGNWELSAFAYALLVEPMHVVVRPLDNPLIDALVERRRGLSGNRLIREDGFGARDSESAGRQPGGGHSDRSERLARERRVRRFLRHARLRRNRLRQTGRAQRRRRDSGVRTLVGSGSAATCCASFRRWRSAATRRAIPRPCKPVSGTGDSRASRPVALGPPPLEDAAARRASPCMKGYPPRPGRCSILWLGPA